MTTEATIEHRVRSADGTSIGYVTLGSGPAVVMVHGTLGTHQSLLLVAQELSRQFTCHVMDRRGRGMSGDAANYRIVREVEDIEAVLATAGAGAYLVGHSYGALCSLLTASRRAVPRLALYEPPWPIHGPAHARCIVPCTAAVARGAYEEAIMTFLSEIGMPAPASMPPEVVALAPTLVREMQGVDSVGPGLEQFERVTMPTLLLLGTLSDQPHIRDTTLELARLAPRAQLSMLDGHGHMANLFAPALVAAEIAGFFTAAR